MKENKHKEIKQKPGGRLPKEQPSRALPKTMARQVWLKSKERVLSATKTDSEGSYASAQEMAEQGIRQGETLMEDGAVSALGKARTAARRHFVHEHKPNGWPTQEEIRGVDSVSPDAMNPDPKTAARQEQKRRAAQKQSRIFQERQRQSKNAVRGLRGVDRDQKTTPHRGQHGAAREAGPTSGSANTDDTAPCQANGPGGCGDGPKGRDCFALSHSTSSGCAAEPCCCADCWGLDCGIYSAFDLFDCAGGRLRLRNFLRGRNTR